ncbi:MAG TPA: NAD(+) synthase [Vicinamibacterales bacterium]|nr:NAD(+) synthase [Vicinamibacterales bacterium]HOG30233.1 NAD(+) synthase [Vicinamibacterales bacterium]HOQ59868.1 NAD(+) synthase [Vicinamibacterales bacterium]HPW20335.1 NAD(+) synthase [Vicinamibacterales bacterium]
MHHLASEMAGWLRERVRAAGARGIVVGLSGGLDSAVVARVAQMAVPGGVLTVFMPAGSLPQDAEDARLVEDTFGLPVMTVDLSDAVDALLDRLHHAAGAQPFDTAPADEAGPRMAVANLKPRLRMAALYYVANRLNYLVAGTGNRCEIAIGYYTKHGDGGVDLLPLGALVKSEVRQLARHLGVPARIIDKEPSAGLWPGQTDEGEMGFTYAELEDYLRGRRASLAPATLARIERLVRASEHKRQMPPVFRPSGE